VAPLTGTKTFVRDPGEREPRQPADGKTSGFPEAMNLSVLPLAKHDAELGSPPGHRKPCHLGRAGRAPVDIDALPEAREIAIFHDALDLRHVHFRRLLPRMEKSEGEVTVVRQQKSPGRTEVESPDGHDPRADARDVFGDRGAPGRIRHRADHVSRLVKHEVHERLARHGPSIHFDAVLLWIGLRSELGHDPAVDGHAARRDQRFSCPAGGDAPGGQDFLQSFARHERALYHSLIARCCRASRVGACAE
jgi:hypothetical protein